MNWNNVKQEHKTICESKGWATSDISQVWMLLIEELGELAGSIRRCTKRFVDNKKVSVDTELMDVLSYILQIADMYDIDLEKVWYKHVQLEIPEKMCFQINGKSEQSYPIKS